MIVCFVDIGVIVTRPLSFHNMLIINLVRVSVMNVNQHF